MYKRVLLPLDGSPLAEQALPHAIIQAKRFQSELILLRVLGSLQNVYGLERTSREWVEEYTIAPIREYLERVAAAAREHGISVRTAIAEGSPHVQIVEFADANQVDLIVICTRGQSGLSRWLMGSVADRVVRGASVPVLLVRARKAQASRS